MSSWQLTVASEKSDQRVRNLNFMIGGCDTMKAALVQPCYPTFSSWRFVKNHPLVEPFLGAAGPFWRPPSSRPSQENPPPFGAASRVTGEPSRLLQCQMTLLLWSGTGPAVHTVWSCSASAVDHLAWGTSLSAASAADGVMNLVLGWWF